MIDTTIITCTDNQLSSKFAGMCRKYLEWSAGDIPIVSVSQKPVELGTNICIGEIGLSMNSMFRQLLAGAVAAKTKYIAIAEHDCLYPEGYFEYVPARDDTFYYNVNYACLYLTHDLYGNFGTGGIRTLLSQLICNRELFLNEIKTKMEKSNGGKCEPDSKYSLFCSKWPTIDIRHDRNFTRAVRGHIIMSQQVTHWGALPDILSYKPMSELCVELEL